LLAAPALLSATLPARIPAGSAAQVLDQLARASGMALAYRQGDLDGVRMPAMPAHMPLARALEHLCPRAGLICRITPLGLLVSRAPPRPQPRPHPPPKPVTPPADPPLLIVSGRRGIPHARYRAQLFPHHADAR
jgi:hypothetical protein